MTRIKISQLKQKTRAYRAFSKKEWALVHPEHFGTRKDKRYWENLPVILVAKDGGKIVGTLSGSLMGGVLYIATLMVAHDARGSGIGAALLKQAEAYARGHKGHRAHLETGVGWHAVGFYEKLGYKPEAKLRDFYEHKDFWVMTKRL